VVREFLRSEKDRVIEVDREFYVALSEALKADERWMTTGPVPPYDRHGLVLFTISEAGDPIALTFIPKEKK